jgi:hypothetical protein
VEEVVRAGRAMEGMLLFEARNWRETWTRCSPTSILGFRYGVKNAVAATVKLIPDL